MNLEGNWTVEEYFKIRDDVHAYLNSPDYSTRQSTFERLNPSHKRVVSDYANSVYENSKLIEPGISKDLMSIDYDEHTFLTSFDHRLKTINSLRRKIIADSKDYEGSYYRAAHNICDSVRYTIISEDEIYIQKVDEILHQLEEMGYEVVDLKNNWGKPIYQGINVRISTKDKKDIFEIQFHTPVSHQIKEKNTRDLYEVIRDEVAPLELKQRANKLRKLLQTRVVPPVGTIEYEYNPSIKRR